MILQFDLPGWIVVMSHIFFITRATTGIILQYNKS